MKKLIILGFILTLFSSCDINNDGSDFVLEILPVESVDIPDSFTLGEVYPITVTYLRPSTCHQFREFYYAKDNNIRTVAVITYNFLDNDCQDLENELVQETFNFKVTGNGSYIFKFWQGEDDNGENQYLTIEVPVTE